MKRKIVAVLTAATLAVGMLAGCGGGGSDSSSGGSKDSSGTTSTDDGSGGSGTAASEGITTEVGTPRSETLIVESSTPTDTPGQFNSYMTGTQLGFGIHIECEIQRQWLGRVLCHISPKPDHILLLIFSQFLNIIQIQP